MESNRRKEKGSGSPWQLPDHHYPIGSGIIFSAENRRKSLSLSRAAEKRKRLPPAPKPAPEPAKEPLSAARRALPTAMIGSGKRGGAVIRTGMGAVVGDKNLIRRLTRRW